MTSKQEKIPALTKIQCPLCHGVGMITIAGCTSTHLERCPKCSGDGKIMEVEK